MADAPPPNRRGRLRTPTWRRRSGRGSQWLQKYLLLLFAAGASLIYREWFTSPLSALLGWAGGIIFYHQAYWLANIRTFKEVQKCSSTLEDAKNLGPGYYFREISNDEWWLYMACLGNEDGWSKGRLDGSGFIYQFIARLSNISVPNWHLVQLVLLLVYVINLFCWSLLQSVSNDIHSSLFYLKLKILNSLSKDSLDGHCFQWFFPRARSSTISFTQSSLFVLTHLPHCWAPRWAQC